MRVTPWSATAGDEGDGGLLIGGEQQIEAAAVGAEVEADGALVAAGEVCQRPRAEAAHRAGDEGNRGGHKQKIL